LKGSGLCIARKKLAVELIAAYANTTLLGTFPPHATYANGGTVTNFPADLISQARAAGAGFDVSTIHSMTALLKKFNSSGLTNDLPNGLVECSAQSAKILRPISRRSDDAGHLSRHKQHLSRSQDDLLYGSEPGLQGLRQYRQFPEQHADPVLRHRWPQRCVAGESAGGCCGRQFSISTSGSNFDTLIGVWSGTWQQPNGGRVRG